MKHTFIQGCDSDISFFSSSQRELGSLHPPAVVCMCPLRVQGLVTLGKAHIPSRRGWHEWPPRIATTTHHHSEQCRSWKRGNCHRAGRETDQNEQEDEASTPRHRPVRKPVVAFVASVLDLVLLYCNASLFESPNNYWDIFRRRCSIPNLHPPL